jgi:hypothetical protein
VLRCKERREKLEYSFINLFYRSRLDREKENNNVHDIHAVIRENNNHLNMFSILTIYYLATQGALNIVTGNASEIGDTLLKSTQVLLHTFAFEISVELHCW